MMRKCMKKLLALSLVMAALLLVFTPVMAEGDREDLYQPIKEFIYIRYDAIAKVKATSGSFRTMAYRFKGCGYAALIFLLGAIFMSLFCSIIVNT